MARCLGRPGLVAGSRHDQTADAGRGHPIMPLVETSAGALPSFLAHAAGTTPLSLRSETFFPVPTEASP